MWNQVFGLREVESEVNSRFSRLRSFSYICQILAHLQLRHEHAVPIHPINPHFRHPTPHTRHRSQPQPTRTHTQTRNNLTKRTHTTQSSFTRAWRHTQHSAHTEYLSLSTVRTKRARCALALESRDRERHHTRYLSPLTYEQRRRDRSEIVAVHGSHSPSPIVSGGSEAHTRLCRRGGALRTSSASYHPSHVAAGHGRTRAPSTPPRAHTCVTPHASLQPRSYMSSTASALRTSASSTRVTSACT